MRSSTTHGSPPENRTPATSSHASVRESSTLRTTNPAGEGTARSAANRHIAAAMSRPKPSSSNESVSPQPRMSVVGMTTASAAKSRTDATANPSAT